MVAFSMWHAVLPRYAEHEKKVCFGSECDLTPLEVSPVHSEPILAPEAVVLLATCNGAAWLDEQLLSLERQDWPVVHVLASDDGSTDATFAILQAWQARWSKGRFDIVSGPGVGFAGNFRHLVQSVQPDAAFYAYCDQDDIWLPGKLRAAAAVLDGADSPALYCGRTIIANEAGAAQHPSQHFRAPPDFRNALVQSIAGGNTMVMNRSAFALVREAMRRTAFVSHDWFTYQIISGVGGRVHYSTEPQILYRQHGGNIVGSNSGLIPRLQRLVMGAGGRFSRWSEANISAMRACHDLLTPAALDTLDAFEKARKGSVLNRLRKLQQAGVYRQSVMGQILLYMACVLGKI